ncbi:HI0074 family nucleotidyltransferase substrate-binding subunit [Bdellovibrionota bacterium FG-1]
MKNTLREKQAIDNLSRAVMKLREFLTTPVMTDRDRAGVIQAFEFSYELAWKTLKKIAEEEGLEVATPLQAIQAGFQMKLIGELEQDGWLKMKVDRNLTSHTYKEDFAAQIFDRIRDEHCALLEALVRRIH